MKEQVNQFLLYFKFSFFFQKIENFSKFVGKQFQESRVITKFLSPPGWELEVGKHSVFFKLWTWIRGALTKVYDGLKLEKIFEGSVFTLCAFWGILVAFLAPFLPTMGVLALAAVTYASLLLTLIRNQEKKLHFASMNRYILLYGVLYLALSFVSVTPSSSVPVGLLSCVLIIFAVVLQNAIHSKDGVFVLMASLSLMAALVALYGMYQYIFRTGYQSAAWVDSEMFDSISFRVASSLDNPNMLGQYFILMIPLTGALLLSAKNWETRLVWFTAAALQCICMLLTFSRGAWLGLLAAGMIFFILLNPKLTYWIPVALIALYMFLPASVIGRFTSIGDISDDSTSYRVYIWMGVFAMLKDYWFSGVGAGDGAFNMVYPAYSYDSIVAPHSHNLFLQILCDGGFFLLLVFLLFLFHYFRGLCVALKHSESQEGKLYQIATLSGTAGFLVQAMTDYSFYNYRVMFLFWVVVALGGLVMSYDRLPKNEGLALSQGVSYEKNHGSHQ
ncbi:MAG: O-antigen ligase family protein [Eubacteriales bacterium]